MTDTLETRMYSVGAVYTICQLMINPDLHPRLALPTTSFPLRARRSHDENNTSATNQLSTNPQTCRHAATAYGRRGGGRAHAMRMADTANRVRSLCDTQRSSGCELHPPTGRDVDRGAHITTTAEDRRNHFGRVFMFRFRSRLAELCVSSV